MSETRPVRASEQLDWPRIEPYLRDRLGVTGDFAAEQFPGGHSNLTYLIRFGDHEFVLRRPPLGPVAPRAHDMAREFRVLQSVHPLFPLAPRPYLLSDDFGFPFYVMERRHGIILRGGAPAPSPAALIDTLADLHSIDTTPIAFLGKPAGFVARQIRGWTERWHGAKTSDIAEMDHVARWLVERVPPDPAQPAIVHGDYKVDNVMLDASDPNRVVAVLDWEMSAIGDPLVDLGIFLCYSVYVDRVLDRDQVLDRYAAKSGRSLDNIGVYEVFALFKLAVVVQQIYARYVKGQTDDPRFAGMGEQVKALARMAATLSFRAA